MTNEELILKDLTARLPYNVKFPIIDWDDDIQEEIQVNATLYSINKDGYVRTLESDYEFDITSIKPYLFPLSSMTEEQKKEYASLVWFNGLSRGWNSDDAIILDEVPMLTDFYHKNHIDYRGLIPMGLAIDATNLNVY